MLCCLSLKFHFRLHVAGLLVEGGIVGAWCTAKQPEITIIFEHGIPS